MVKWIREKYDYIMIIFRTKMLIHTNIHHSLPNKNLRGCYGIREACGSENLMLGAFLAGFGKTNARAPMVAGLVYPRH